MFFEGIPPTLILWHCGGHCGSTQSCVQSCTEPSTNTVPSTHGDDSPINCSIMQVISSTCASLPAPAGATLLQGQGETSSTPLLQCGFSKKCG